MDFILMSLAVLTLVGLIVVGRYIRREGADITEHDMSRIGR